MLPHFNHVPRVCHPILIFDVINRDFLILSANYALEAKDLPKPKVQS